MLEPKKLYTVKQDCWLVFPTKEDVGVCAVLAVSVPAELGTASAEFLTKQLSCLVSFIAPNNNFMVVEVDGKFVKIVGNKIGWIVADMSVDWARNCFEEITS